MDLAQITPYLLVFTVTSLTIVLVISGIWVIKILKEFFKTVTQVNQILDDAKVVSESVAEPVATLSDFLMGLKSGWDLVAKFWKKKGRLKTKINLPPALLAGMLLGVLWYRFLSKKQKREKT